MKKRRRLVRWRSCKASSSGGCMRPPQAPASPDMISISPRSFQNTPPFRHFMPPGGCPQMKRSTVVGSKNQGVVDEIRTSYGTFLR